MARLAASGVAKVDETHFQAFVGPGSRARYRAVTPSWPVEETRRSR